MPTLVDIRSSRHLEWQNCIVTIHEVDVFCHAHAVGGADSLNLPSLGTDDCHWASLANLHFLQLWSWGVETGNEAIARYMGGERVVGSTAIIEMRVAWNVRF